MKTAMDLYTDYLLSSFGQTTATGLSAMLDKAVSHDAVTRFLSHLESGSQAAPGKASSRASGKSFSARRAGLSADG